MAERLKYAHPSPVPADVLRGKPPVTHTGNALSEAPLTFRADEALKTEFTTAAKAGDRSRAQLLREFVQQQRDAAGYDEWFRQQVQAGLAPPGAARLVPSAGVETHLAARRAATSHRLKTGE